MPNQAPVATMPFLLTGPELYDLIMSGIEPDLMVEHMERTKQAILDATPEKRAEMGRRYDLAFAKYDVRATEHQEQWMEQFRQYKRTSMQQLEAQVRAADNHAIGQLESDISSSAA